MRRITITEVKVLFAGSSIFIEADAPFEANVSDSAKYIYLNLTIEDSSYPLTGSMVEIPQQRIGAAGTESSACKISIGGMANIDSGEEWNAGDVKIVLNYQLDAVESDKIDNSGTEE